MGVFLIRLKRTAAFQESMLLGHRQHLQNLRERKVLLAMGPFVDGTGGAYVIEAESIEEAERIVREDPACQAGGMEADIREWNVTYADFRVPKG